MDTGVYSKPMFINCGGSYPISTPVWLVKRRETDRGTREIAGGREPQKEILPSLEALWTSVGEALGGGGRRFLLFWAVTVIVGELYR